MRLLGSRQPAGGPQDSPQEEDGWEAQVGGLAVVRKAMYALSALLRGDSGSSGSEEVGNVEEYVATVALTMPTLCTLAAHPDGKLRKRTLFLLAALASETNPAVQDVVFSQAIATSSALPAALVTALSAEDEDTRVQAARVMLAAAAAVTVGGGAAATSARALGARVGASGGVPAVHAAMGAVEAAGADADPEEAARLKTVLPWMQ